LKVLDFFLENSRTWKVLENHFGPGKSWKLKFKVLESPGKINQTPCAVQPKKKNDELTVLSQELDSKFLALKKLLNCFYNHCMYIEAICK